MAVLQTQARIDTQLPEGKMATNFVTQVPQQDSGAHYKDWPNAAGFNALEDTKTPIELQVSGHFPDYAAGSLYRTGPGGYKVPDTDPKKKEIACSHWFDGFIVTHKFHIAPSTDQGGMRVMYSSYRQVDELIETARQTGKITGITFGQKRDPCDSLYRKMKTTFEPVLPSTPNSMNLGVVLRETLPSEAARLGDKNAPTLTVTSDNFSTKQFDSDTLEPLGVTNQTDIHPSLKGPVSASHASRDPENGDLYNFNLDFGPVMIYRIFRVSAQTGKVDILTTLPGMQGAYIHSLFLTENFVILCIWPAFFTMNGISILWARNFLEALKFDKNAKVTWLVVDRRGNRGLVRKFTSPAFFCFHTTNAWEVPRDDGNVDILCELAQFQNMDILHKFYYENLVSNGPNVAAFQKSHSTSCRAALARYKLADVPLRKPSQTSSSASSWTLPPLLSKRAERVLHSVDAGGDLQVINPRCALKPHRYVWSCADRGKSSFMDGLCKTDTHTLATLFWERQGHCPGEPIFIANPAGTAEDDGVLLSVVLDGPAGTSYLLCLDARTMQEVASADVRKAVGFGFHGLHVKDVQ